MPNDTASHQPEPDKERRVVALVYILQVLGLLSAGGFSLIAIIIAHIKSNDLSGIYSSHNQYQIRTFWFGLAIAIVGGILTIILIGWLILAFLGLWTLIRTVKGFLALNDGRALDDPTTALW